MVLDDGAMLVVGPAVLVNTSSRPLMVLARVDADAQPAAGQPPASGQPSVPASVRGLVQPRAVVTLAATPAGYSWTVAWVSRRTAQETAAWALGAVLVVGSLAGYGLVDLVRDVAASARKKQRRR
jgi:hypothetical protein